MKIFGIIAEFNPFHNGHKYLIDSIRKKFPDAVFVIIMSGSFVQRGEPAIFDKWQRAHMALLGGADLIIELPTVFSLRSAEGFAQGAVKLLAYLNCIDYICFGSETSDITTLIKIADFLNNDLQINSLREKLQQGSSYAAAISELIAQYLPSAKGLLQEPNIILGIEYLKTMQQINAAFSPIIIKRQISHHNDTTINGTISSATSIRNLLHSLQYNRKDLQTVLPADCFGLITANLDIADNNRLFPILTAKLRCTNTEELKKYAQINNGLEFKFLQAASTAKNINELVDKVKSKHYHHSRLRRNLMHILLNISADSLNNFTALGPQYARVLGFNGQGQTILKKIKKQAQIPAIIKTTQFLSQKQLWQHPLSGLQKMLAVDIHATDLQALCYPQPKNAGRDFYTSPIYLK